MRRHFNIAGPCIPAEHYMLPPGPRVVRAMQCIEDRKYFVLAAGRQTGKMTCAMWLQQHYNAGDECLALWVDLQTAREQPDVAIAMRSILAAFDVCIERDLPELPRPSAERIAALLQTPEQALWGYLTDLCRTAPRPLVLLLDEADSLVGAAMVSFLTQLRSGYIGRSRAPFPQSIGLIGMRAVRDFVLSEAERRAVSWLGTASPFNITADLMTLAPFSEAQVTALLGQHTAATGQVFLPDAIARIWALSQGHPWLVNALAEQIVDRDLRGTSSPITGSHVDSAKETIILERRSHIDSLLARLREPRVRRVLDPMLAGGRLPDDILDDDVAYVLGLGLIRMTGGQCVVSNPIYREVIPRTLSYVQQIQLYQQTAWYVRPDGGLDLPKLMAAWQTFWRKDGHLAAEGFAYRESGPHLMLMAFLQRIVNGGGRIEREYGLGRRALDLLIVWQQEQHAIEVKLRRDTETETDALEQVTGYLDSLGLKEGWLVLFDLRSTQPWSERLTTRRVEFAGKIVWIVGC